MIKYVTNIRVHKPVSKTYGVWISESFGFQNKGTSMSPSLTSSGCSQTFDDEPGLSSDEAAL